jgi:glycogen synthase
MTTTTAAASATPEPRPLWLTETYPPSRGGMAQSCDRIVRGLRRRGIAVDLLHFTPRAHGRPWRIETQAGGRYLACPVEDDPAHALNRAWSTLQPDPQPITHVVAFGGSRPIMAAPVFAAWLGVPLITLIRGNDFDAAVFSARRRPILQQALEASSLVCAVSREKVSKIAALHPGTRVRWVPNGIDLTDWEFAPSDRAKAAAWRATIPQRRVLGLFGQLKAKKGGVFLLDAFERAGLADEVHLLLAGWMEPEMEARLGALSATVLPFLDRFELLPWYAACDWIAIPSFYDGLPNVLVEAAALGIPMVASRVDGMADVLSDGETAFLFGPGDEARCAWALQRAARLDEAQHARMAEACRELARRELDGELEIDRYVDALAQARPLAVAR